MTGWIAHEAVGGRAATPTMLAADAVDAHRLFVTEVRHPVEVPASQEAHLAQWLSNRLGRTLRVPNLAPLGFRLMGRRLLPGEGVPAAQFMYGHERGARLTLYMRAEPGEDGTGFDLIERNGVSGFHWMDRGFGYAVLAEAGRDRLLPVAKGIHAGPPPHPSHVGAFRRPVAHCPGPRRPYQPYRRLPAQLQSSARDNVGAPASAP